MQCGLDNVSFAYGDKAVLDGVTLAFPWQGSVCLFGPSGCGKSTVLRLLAGLERPHAGRIVGMRERRIAMLFQENRLLPWSSLAENVLLGMGKEARTDQALAWLEAVGLRTEAEQRPDALSGGMRRRAALARALAMPSDILLLDEPLKELDTENQQRMQSLIQTQAQRKLLVLVTHDRREAEALCEHVWTFEGPPFRRADED